MRKHIRSVVQLLSDLHHKLDRQIRAAEIGVWKCECSRGILETCPWVDLLLVDEWCPNPHATRREQWATFSEKHHQGLYEAALALGHQFYPRVNVMRKSSFDAARELFEDERNQLDLVFIDACHEYDSIADDLAAWTPLVRPGGVVSGHDYNGRHPGVVRAVHEWAAIQGVSIVRLPGNVWFAYKE